MTVNEYLWYLEWLRIDMLDKREKYFRALDIATSPQSSLDFNEDGLRHRNTYNGRERLLTDKMIESREAFYQAYDKYREYKYQLEINLKKLNFMQYFVLDSIYITHLGKPIEKRRDGISEILRIKEKDLPRIIKTGKKALKQILIDQGIDIED